VYVDLYLAREYLQVFTASVEKSCNPTIELPSIKEIANSFTLAENSLFKTWKLRQCCNLNEAEHASTPKSHLLLLINNCNNL
jgi:hypothetical protein